MRERTLKRIIGANLRASDFEQNPLVDRIKALEDEVSALKSYVNSIGKTELVGEGTADNPFVLTVGMELVPNAYYAHDGIRHVYMGTANAWDGSELTFANGWTEF